jgi:hypothetical protein
MRAKKTSPTRNVPAQWFIITRKIFLLVMPNNNGVNCAEDGGEATP